MRVNQPTLDHERKQDWNFWKHRSKDSPRVGRCSDICQRGRNTGTFRRRWSPLSSRKRAFCHRSSPRYVEHPEDEAVRISPAWIPVGSCCDSGHRVYRSPDGYGSKEIVCSFYYRRGLQNLWSRIAFEARETFERGWNKSRGIGWKKSSRKRTETWESVGASIPWNLRVIVPY